MAEMFTMQRYLQLPLLEQMGLAHFDAWAQAFGETVTALELAPEGKGYRPKTRFARLARISAMRSAMLVASRLKQSRVR